MRNRILIWLPALTAVISLALAITSSLQITIYKQDSAEMLALVDRNYIDRSNFNAGQLQALDRHLQRIITNEHELRRVHIRLYWIATAGFLSLAALAAICAVAAARATDEKRPDTFGTSP